MNLISLQYCKTLIVIFFLLGSTFSFSQTRVVMLGSGNPNPDPNHQGPGVAIVVNEQAYLIDFGTGIVRQAAALTPQYGGSINALNAKQLNIAFLTHLHADHTIGLPDLIFTPWIMGRDKPLKIIGPEGVKNMTTKVLEAYQEDIRYRLYGLEPANNQGWRVEAHEIQKEGIVYEDSLVTVEAFNVSHGTWPQCFGFRFTTPDRVVVISGDTSPSKNLVKWAKGADVLVHEVYYNEGWTKKTEFWKEYHQANHTSTFELAEIAQQVQPKLLVCYHTLYWGGNELDILSEINSKYPGVVVIGQDGMIY
jgi:ribonuclease BN (tRNA processing enzyme)